MGRSLWVGCRCIGIKACDMLCFDVCFIWSVDCVFNFQFEMCSLMFGWFIFISHMSSLGIAIL